MLTGVLAARTAVWEPAAHQPAIEPLHATGVACAKLAGELGTSRAFAQRTSGLGKLSAVEVRARNLTGPCAWASDTGRDARSSEPLYNELGFRPMRRQEGDARARALIRVEDAAQAIALAERAIGRLDSSSRRSPSSFAAAAEAEVEGPRGPVNVAVAADGSRRRSAPGAREARETAGDLAAGLEWGAALVVIASFDLSPWLGSA